MQQCRKWTGWGLVPVLMALAGVTALAGSAAAQPEVREVSSTTTATADPNPAAVGESVDLVADVVCTGFVPTGNVTFFDGGNLLSTQPVEANGPNGRATFTTTFGTAGTHPITASYSGDANCFSSFDEFDLVVQGTGSTTELTASPTSPQIGQPVTLTAQVTCETGSPAGGTVTFTDTTTGQVLGSDVVVGGPPTGTASIDATNLSPGTHVITASFAGVGTCGSSSDSVTVVVGECTTISDDFIGNLTVTTPTCLAPGTDIMGNVTISGAGSLRASDASIRGNLIATGGTYLRFCDGNVSGSVDVSGINGVITIGDAGDDGFPRCRGNFIDGNVTLSNNTGSLEFSDNFVDGSATVDNNTHTIQLPPENATTTELEDNHIDGNLSCSGNVPPPTNDGQPNNVDGQRSGQCTGL